MIAIKLCLAIVLAAVTAHSQASAHVTVTLATGEWPPYMSAQLKHQGFATRIVKEAFATQGVQADIHFYPWPRTTALVQSRTVDGAFAYSRSPEREKQFLFSAPVIEGSNVFYYLKTKKFAWHKLDDLNGLRIGGNAGYNYGEAFAQAERAGKFTLDRSLTEEDNFNKLLAGRLDLVLTNRDVGNFVLQTHFHDRQQQITSHPHALITLQNYFIVARTHPRATWLISTFNRGLAQLRQQGKLRQYAEESLHGDYLPSK